MNILHNSETLRSLTGSRKKRAFVHIVRDGSEQNTASYWDGGSRHTYSVYNIKTREYKIPPAGAYPQFKANYTLLPDEILLQLGTFQGKPATPTLYIQESNRSDIETLYGPIATDSIY